MLFGRLWFHEKIENQRPQIWPYRVLRAKAKRSKTFWPAKIQETNVEVDDLNESKSQTADKRGIKQSPLVKVVLYGSGKMLDEL